MSTISEVTSASHRADGIRRQIDRAMGRSTGLRDREAETSAAVAAAKARLLAKPEVDEFLEELQAAVHRRMIGSYEEMLTALVSDVLEQDLAIKLTLSTHMGLPGLDIEAEHEGARASILEGCGGSLNNVVSLGLRAIATRRSGLRPFLALDEADCWIRPGRVKAFYSVLHRLSDLINMQSLVISHHPSDVFPAGQNVVEVSGTPNRGVTAKSVTPVRPWPSADTPGIRSIRLMNFASIVDTTITLGPGVTAIIGENNIGKSRFLKALRAVFHGGSDSSDGDIRHGQKMTQVEIMVENGLKLTWSRKPGRNPVTLWKLTDANGATVQHKGAECSGTGASRQPPEWVRETLGIAKVDDLDLQISRQLTPVFLLAEPPSRRASVLSIGRESNKIRKMIETHRQRCITDASTVRTGEQQIASIREAIARMEALPGLMTEIEAVIQQLAELAPIFAREAQCMKMANDLDESIKLLNRSQAMETILADIPEEDALNQGVSHLQLADGLVQMASNLDDAKNKLYKSDMKLEVLKDLPEELPEMPKVDPIINMGVALKNAVIGLNVAEAKLAVLQTLPDALPEMPNAEPILQMAANMDNALCTLRVSEIEERRVQDDLQNCENKIALLVSEMGNICPGCGAPIGSDGRHSHEVTH